MGAQEVSENFSMCTRDCSCDILVKNVPGFCPCLKTLPEVKVNIFILIALTKEVSISRSENCVFHFWIAFIPG